MPLVDPFIRSEWIGCLQVLDKFGEVVLLTLELLGVILDSKVIIDVHLDLVVLIFVVVKVENVQWRNLVI